MSTVIQIRRGSEEEANSFIGYEGELFIDLDNKTLRYHDGIKLGGHIIGAVTLEGISKISSISYLNSIHVLDDQISVMGHMRPTQDVVYDLGSADYRFKDLYLGGQTINISGVQIYVDDNGDLQVPGYATQTYADDVATAAVDLEVIARDAAILAAIATEVADRNTAISNAIDIEQINRDAAISLSISAEVVERDNAISNAVSAAISTEVIDRNNAITTAISTEVNDRNAAILVEVNDRITAISTEVTDRNNAISTAIATEVSDRNTAISNAIATEVSDRNTAISTAVSNLIDTAPATLDTLNELAAALGDDANFATTVSTSIGNVQSELDATQTGAGLDTDGSYVAVASNYISAATSLMDADITLDTELKAVDTAYKSADTTLQGNIDAEELRATTAEGVLQGNIDAEELRATTAEGVLQDNIDAEAATRLADDTALSGRLDIIEGTGEGSIIKAVADTAALKADLTGASFTGNISLGANDLNDVSNINNTDALNISAGNGTAQLYLNANNVIIDAPTTVGGTVAADGFIGDGSTLTDLDWNAITNPPVITQTVFNATAGQDTFNLTYAPGSIDVYLNGLKLIETVDFIANNSTSIVLTDPAAAGDTLDVLVGTSAAARLVDLSIYATRTYLDTKPVSSFTNDVNYQTDQQVAITVANVVNNMLDSAPAALDTLNELAAALGDDPNFATTVANDLATKANAADVYTSTEVDNLIANLEAYDQSLNKQDSVEFANVTIQSVINLTPMHTPPTTPIEGTIAMADGTNWDPEGSGNAGTQPVVYSNGTWKSLILQVYDQNGVLL